MHSVSDLTTSSRKTTGDVPPKLVGASTTVVGSKMYLFGGRLVTERRMVADLYMFDLETFVWQKIVPNLEDDVPGARYFHSTDTWRNHLVIFGGMGHKADTSTSDDLCVLNDVRFFDLSSKRWLPAGQAPPSTSSEEQPSSLFIPRARYAHLSSVTGNRLFIIGGQDLNNLWLDDVCVFDLEARAWVHRREYRRHSGTYRSVAVSANMRTRFPAEEMKSSAQKSTSLGPPGGRYKVDKRPSSAKGEYTPSDKLAHLPYSTEPSDEFPNDIYLYSNYNFTDVQRELEIFKPVQGGEEFQLEERSSSMTGTVLPPGLRFPTGAICGTHLIFAGTYLAHSYQSYSIWALDLKTMAWSRLDPGSALSSGSWFRACLWSVPGNSKFLIFGNRAGNLVEDYNRRLLSWDDVAVIDLEAFGIYQAPTLTLDLRSQELGLAALEEELFADFEVVCDDGRRINCSRKILESRWPWFKDQRKLFVDNASRALESIPPANGDVLLVPDPTADARPGGEEPRLDPRLSPRSLVLSEPYPITLALLQYFYSLALLTPLQHAPAVLSQLMLLSATYNLPHLQLLVKHAMHRALTPATSVGVYEVATLCSCQSLQIRLQVVGLLGDRAVTRMPLVAIKDRRDPVEITALLDLEECPICVA
ncbi:regulatory protein ral2 [Schizopora paradoxa]|uniref:Regulatory protein ral2 n=1 Tax=Schizopora paradoxa TaxID=27342 RepID=A0A0H2RYR9_9AGAM|nr:regulatory protein ral2 [Schizopora paradoxa]